MDTISNYPEINKDTYWESIAKSEWGNYISEVEKKAILKANNLFSIPSTALEIGCEGGRWSKLLIDLGWNMICTDIDQNSLDLCQKRIPAAKCVLVKEDETTLPCASESLNLILCIEVPYILESDWFMTEAFRTLQDNGCIVGVFRNKLSFRGYFQHISSSMKGTLDYYNASYPKWRSKFCKQGFNMLSQEGICWFPFKRNSNSPLVHMFTRLEYYLGLRLLPSISPWIVFIAQKEERKGISGG